VLQPTEIPTPHHSHASSSMNIRDPQCSQTSDEMVTFGKSAQASAV